MKDAIFTNKQTKKMRLVLEKINKSEVVQESLLNSTKKEIKQALEKKNPSVYSECLASIFASLNNQIIRLNLNYRDNNINNLNEMNLYNKKLYNFICANVRFLSPDLADKIYQINTKVVYFQNCGGQDLKYKNYLEKAILEVRREELSKTTEVEIEKVQKELYSLAKKQDNILKREEKVKNKVRKILKELKKVKLARNSINKKVEKSKQELSDLVQMQKD